MEEEVKMVFQLMYLPVAQANQRLNGGDFISVAIPLMDELRRQNPNEVLLKKAARIMVMEFNNLLNPKMPVHQIDELVNLIYKPGEMTRMMATQIAEEFARKHNR